MGDVQAYKVSGANCSRDETLIVYIRVSSSATSKRSRKMYHMLYILCCIPRHTVHARISVLRRFLRMCSKIQWRKIAPALMKRDRE